MSAAQYDYTNGVEMTKPKRKYVRKSKASTQQSAVTSALLAQPDAIRTLPGSRPSANTTPAYLPQETKIPTTNRKRRANNPVEPMLPAFNSVQENEESDLRLHQAAQEYGHRAYMEFLAHNFQ